MEKFASRKLIVCLIVLIAAAILRYFDRLGDWPFVVLFGGTVVAYLFVQGVVNINRIRVNTPALSITPEPEKTKESIDETH